MADVALVTGAGGGIGAAIARRLAAAGMTVGVVDLDADAAAAIATEVGGLALVADVADEDSLAAAARTLAGGAGDITVLVNNAGITRNRMLHKLKQSEWDLIHNVCLRGCANGFRAVAPWFRNRENRRPRRVVSVTSLAGTRGAFGSAAYASAKAGVVGLTQTMALEWADLGVCVNAVAPGVIATDMSRDVQAAMADQIPLGRLGSADEVAAVVAFLAGPEASYVTGQVIEIAGGLTSLMPSPRS